MSTGEGWSGGVSGVKEGAGITVESGRAKEKDERRGSGAGVGGGGNGPISPRKTKRGIREERGGDGIGRLDA